MRQHNHVSNVLCLSLLSQFLVAFPFLLISLSCKSKSDSTDTPSGEDTQQIYRYDEPESIDLNGQYELPGIQNYQLLLDAERTWERKDSLSEFYVWPGIQLHDPVPADCRPFLIQENCWSAGDTNVVVYSSTSHDSVYLIALRLGSEVVADTLYGALEVDPDNPITNRCNFFCLMRDSLFYFIPQTRPNLEPVQLWKLTPEGTWVVKLQLPSMWEADYSHDFTQLLFVTAPEENPPYHGGTLLIFDLQLDSLYQVAAYGYGIKEAKRQARSKPIYFIKQLGNDINLWQTVSPTEAKKISDVPTPYYVSMFELFDDSLRFQVLGPHNYPYYEGDRIIPLVPTEVDSLEMLRK